MYLYNFYSFESFDFCPFEGSGVSCLYLFNGGKIKVSSTLYGEHSDLSPYLSNAKSTTLTLTYLVAYSLTNDASYEMFLCDDLNLTNLPKDYSIPNLSTATHPFVGMAIMSFVAGTFSRVRKGKKLNDAMVDSFAHTVNSLTQTDLVDLTDPNAPLSLPTGSQIAESASAASTTLTNNNVPVVHNNKSSFIVGIATFSTLFLLHKLDNFFFDKRLKGYLTKHSIPDQNVSPSPSLRFVNGMVEAGPKSPGINPLIQSIDPLSFLVGVCSLIGSAVIMKIIFREIQKSNRSDSTDYSEGNRRRRY